MLQKTLPVSLIALTLTGAPAQAGPAYFCSPYSWDKTYDPACREVKIQNKSSALVKAVIVTQQTSGDACARDERKFKDNLKRNDTLWVFLTPECSYKIRFKTESRCRGDSTAYMTPNKFSKSMDTVLLKSNCDNLKTEVKTGSRTPPS